MFILDFNRILIGLQRPKLENPLENITGYGTATASNDSGHC